MGRKRGFIVFISGYSSYRNYRNYRNYKKYRNYGNNSIFQKEGAARRDVARRNSPEEMAVGVEVEKFAARYVVLGIEEVEVTIAGIDDDAIGQGDVLYFGSCK